MKIVVTGHEGFIGSNLKAELEKKYEVLGIELRDLPNLDDILETYKPSAIFHVGACSDTLQQDVELMMKLNWETTTLLSDYCKKLNIPMVYSSTAAIYGDDNSKRNLYAWSKHAGEKHVTANNQIALRYFNVYGPGEEHKGVMASIAYQSYTKHKQSTAVKLFPGQPRRDFVYVKDVVDANLYALKNYFKLEKKYYEVGVGKAETFEYILENLEIPFTYLGKEVVPKGYQYYTSSESMHWMKGWKPKYNLEKGLNEYKEYLCKTI